MGVTIHTYIYDAFAGTVLYSLSCSDYPVARVLTTKAKVLKMLRGSARARVGGAPMDLKEVEVNGYTGIEYAEHIGEGKVYHQAFVVGEKLYQLDVGDMLGKGRVETDRFFQSFSVD